MLEVSRGSREVSRVDPGEVGETLLDYGLVAVVSVDGEGRITGFSRAAETMFGRSESEVRGRELVDVILPERLRQSQRPVLAGLFCSGRGPILGRRLEQAAVRADGSEFRAELTLMRSVVRPRAYVAMLRDVSERQRSQQQLARSRALLARAEELACSGSFERGLGRGTWCCSEGFYRVLGLPETSQPPPLEDLLTLVHPEDRAAAVQAARELRGGSGRFEHHVRIRRPDGRARVIEIRGELQAGPPERVLGTVRDVTEEVEAAGTRDFLSHLVESSDDCIYSVSGDGVIMSWNRGAEKLLGYTAEEAVGQHKRMLVPPTLTEEQARLIARVFRGEPIRDVHTRRQRKDGSTVWVSLTMSPVRDGQGRVVSAAVVARDETERRRYEQRLKELADHDPLTGLLNRRRFVEELEREIHRAGRGGPSGAVLSVDLDGFKAINDSAGHQVGDAVLRAVADTLRLGVRRSDVVGRMGGDEFDVLLPDTGCEQAQTVAEHLLQAVRGCRVEIEGTVFSVTASIGASLFGPGSGSAEELLTGADLAMYEAKQHGRDQIVVFTAAAARLARSQAKLTWSQRVRQALDEDRLVLHWQPIAEVRSGEVSHGELLLRLREGEVLIAPDTFLPAAEQLGLIHEIDRWVVRRAIALLAGQPAAERRPVSVNLSAESITGDGSLLTLVAQELGRGEVDPGLLIFEVTDTAAMDLSDARTFAQELRQLGCRLALDDFGTGFASFTHLKHLPVDFIKIDREFVRDLPASPLDCQLVQGLVATARLLGLRTVAEAVEDERTLEVLRQLGVDYVQGYQIGFPRPV